jgi:hypothetical protein
MVMRRVWLALIVCAAVLTVGATSGAQDASGIDAGARDAAVTGASAQDAGAGAPAVVQPLLLAPDVAAGFPLDVTSRRAQRTVQVVRASIITMIRCSTEYAYQRVIVYNTRRCNDAWWAVDPTMNQPTFAAAIVGMLAAPTEAERRYLTSEPFAQQTWPALLRMFTGDADYGELPPSFVAFALRALAAVPAASPLDFVVRDLHHLLDRQWGYDPSPVAPWGDASAAYGTRAQREAHLRRSSEFAMANRGARTAARDRAFIEQSRRDLTSADLVVRWRALQRLLRRRSLRDVHREAVDNLQALWRDRASLPAAARSYINGEISLHMAYWNLPQTNNGGFRFEPRP